MNGRETFSSDMPIYTDVEIRVNRSDIAINNKEIIYLISDLPISLEDNTSLK